MASSDDNEMAPDYLFAIEKKNTATTAFGKTAKIKKKCTKSKQIIKKRYEKKNVTTDSSSIPIRNKKYRKRSGPDGETARGSRRKNI